ncbi:cell division protein FtsK [Novacetimonas maltaceti]|uniref:DNA translocase FtsK n=1 Tax=Novacetimonas maltaceti TaxID=1203393 RepID=UPI000D724FB1|nr:DNA translocase FtsK [Novacetimonas maltaceti]PYD60158.1 cell division protein FtsK [Novacetimonas maltaceti]
MAIPGRFIPESLTSGPTRIRLVRRLAETGGVALWMLALALMAALWSYDPRDSSANTSSAQAPTNLLGTVGAYVSDFLLQNMGATCALVILALIAWGWRIIRHNGVGSGLLRVTALLAAMPVVSALLAALPIMLPSFPNPQWPADSGLGGAVGLSIAHMALQAGVSLMGPWGRPVMWLLGLVLALLLIPLAMALSLSEWRAIGRALRTVGRQPARLAAGTQALANSIRARTSPPAAPVDTPPRMRDSLADALPEEELPPRRMTPDRPPAAPDPTLPVTEYPAVEATADAPSRAMTPPPPVPPPATSRSLSVRESAHPPLPPARDVAAPPAAAASLPAAARQGRVSIGTNWVHPPGMEEDIPPPLLETQAGSQDVAPWHEAPPPPATTFTPPAAPQPERPTLLGRLFSTGGATRPPAPSAPVVEDPPPPAPHAASVPAEEQYDAPQQHAWQLPPLSLLHPPPSHATTGPTEELLRANAAHLVTVLSEYGVQGEINTYHAGPVVTLFELMPAPGIRAARVIGLADDVARSLSVLSVRIATVPGRNVIGIEVPNTRRDTVYFSELLHDERWVHARARLNLALGKDIAGEPVYSDLGSMPHLMIAGTTGSGKSVGVNAMILSLLYRLSPDQCRLILIDPKILEFSIYEGIPHLMTPVVTEPAKAVAALKWTVREMDRRYRAMAHLQVRNIASYNERVAEARARGEIVTRRVQTGYDPETGKPTFEEQQLALDALPYIVVIVDEMADLMIVAGKEIEALLQRLAQKARAAGIHLIIATQRPSVDVITGTIKANFPTRISFQVISKFDSRTILGEQGAEQLLGRGDMLFMQAGGRITRVHGPFVEDSEVEAVVAFLRAQGEPIYDDDVISAQDEDGGGRAIGGGGGEEDSLFGQAVELVAREGKASTSFIQRHLSIGYNRAAKIIEQMEKEGLVSEANHVGRREVLMRKTAEDE